MCMNATCYYTEINHAFRKQCINAHAQTMGFKRLRLPSRFIIATQQNLMETFPYAMDHSALSYIYPKIDRHDSVHRIRYLNLIEILPSVRCKAASDPDCRSGGYARGAM